MALGFQMRGLFGRKPMTGATMGGFGGGTFNMDGTRADEPEWLPQPSAAPQQQMSKPGGGLFGKIGGAMGDIGAILDDSPSGMQAREMEYRQQQDRSRALAAQQQAEAENAQWYEREKWKRDNPTPTNNDTINDFNWYKNLSPEDQAVYHRMKPQYRVGPDGLMYPVQVAQPIAAPAGVTFTPIVDGGPTQPASGSFPRR